jgi:hypothetical protein
VSFTTDVWTDPNLRPFMAATAHWIETRASLTGGSQYLLELRSELIAFHILPGRHTGEHLARSFLAILDRVQIADKVC